MRLMRLESLSMPETFRDPCRLRQDLAELLVEARSFVRVFAEHQSVELGLELCCLCDVLDVVQLQHHEVKLLQHLNLLLLESLLMRTAGRARDCCKLLCMKWTGSLTICQRMDATAVRRCGKLVSTDFTCDEAFIECAH